MDIGKTEHSGKTYKQVITFKQINKDVGKKIVKTIKDAKLKVQNVNSGRTSSGSQAKA